MTIVLDIALVAFSAVTFAGIWINEKKAKRKPADKGRGKE